MSRRCAIPLVILLAPQLGAMDSDLRAGLWEGTIEHGNGIERIVLLLTISVQGRDGANAAESAVARIESGSGMCGSNKAEIEPNRVSFECIAIDKRGEAESATGHFEGYFSPRSNLVTRTWRGQSIQLTRPPETNSLLSGDWVAEGGGSTSRRSDRVRVACLAQLVNVIAPIVTDENGLIRQTIYYPYLWALQHGKRQALDLAVESNAVDQIADVDVSATFDPAAREYALFLLNRNLAQEQEVNLFFHDDAPSRVVGFETLTGGDLKASNTIANPIRIHSAQLEAPKPGAQMVVKLPAQSYSLLRVRA